MLFYLKLKDKFVAKIEYNIEDDKIQLKTVLDPDRLPLMVKYHQSKKKGFEEWMNYRSIPKTRRNLADILAASGATSIESLTIKNLGLSLSDSYWICPADSSLTWNSINLYENDFAKSPFEVASLSSQDTTFPFRPDSSSNGELRKSWEVRNGTRVLSKESTQPYYQQAYNEIFADKLLTRMNIKHVSYSLENHDEIPYSICSAFTSENIEYVPAWYIMNASKKIGSESSYQHFFKCLECANIDIEQREVESMLAFDYLINNTDRHFGNFGFLRNVDTLEFIGAAPLFDHGNSMWYNALSFDITRYKQCSKPFKDTFEQQNKILSVSELPIENLTDDFISEAIFDTYSINPRFEEERLIKMANEVMRGRDELLSIQRNRKPNLITKSHLYHR